MTKRKPPIPDKILLCYLCGCLISKEFEMDRTPTRDHLKPKSQGGKGIRFSCYRCNQDKADIDLYDFVNDYQNINAKNFLKRNENDLEVISLYNKQKRSR